MNRFRMDDPLGERCIRPGERILRRGRAKFKPGGPGGRTYGPTVAGVAWRGPARGPARRLLRMTYEDMAALHRRAPQKVLDVALVVLGTAKRVRRDRRSIGRGDGALAPFCITPARPRGSRGA
jgi:hypothetical protein